MSQFLENAREIFEAAETSLAAGHTPGDYTILLGGINGGMRLVAGSDWSLDALRREHGAKVAYRVNAENGRVKVDGQEGTRSCHLEGMPAAQVAHFLLNAAPAWHGSLATPALRTTRP